MIESNVCDMPSRHTYYHMIRICQLSGHHANALAFYDIMKSRDFLPDTETMNFVLKAGLASGDVGRASRSLVSLLVNEVTLDQTVVINALDACLQRQEWMWALELCDAVKQNQKLEVDHEELYHVVLRRSINHGDSNAAVKILSRMQQEGIHIDPMLAAEIFGSAAVGNRDNVHSGIQTVGGSQNATGLLFSTNLDSPETVQYMEPSRNGALPKDAFKEMHDKLHEAILKPISPSISPVTKSDNVHTRIHKLTESWLENTESKELQNSGVQLKSANISSLDKSSYVSAIDTAVRENNQTLALKICREAHIVGALNIYSVPKPLYAVQRNGAGSDWEPNIDLCGYPTTFSVVVVASWLVEANQALQWGYALPDFEYFQIACNSEDPPGLHALTSELLRLLTSGHSRTLNQHTVPCFAAPNDGTFVVFVTEANTRSILHPIRVSFILRSDGFPR